MTPFKVGELYEVCHRAREVLFATPKRQSSTSNVGCWIPVGTTMICTNINMDTNIVTMLGVSDGEPRELALLNDRRLYTHCLKRIG